MSLSKKRFEPAGRPLPLLEVDHLFLRVVPAHQVAQDNPTILISTKAHFNKPLLLLDRGKYPLFNHNNNGRGRMNSVGWN